MFKRLKNLVMGFFSLFVKGLESNNTEALLENLKNTFKQQEAQFSQELARLAGFVETLSANAKKLDIEAKDYEVKAKTLLTAGKRDLAAQAALRMQTAKDEYSKVVVRLSEEEQKYKDLTKTKNISLKKVRDKMDSISENIKDTNLRKKSADMLEMANGIISGFSDQGEELNRIEELVNNEKSLITGRERVAKDSIDMTDINMTEAASGIKADMALEELEKSMGIFPTPTPLILNEKSDILINDLLKTQQKQTYETN